MTKTMAKLALAAVVALALAVPASAGEAVVLEGKVVCAKCTLKRADAKECQNVLLVPQGEGKESEYYITKNEADAEFGEVCTEVRAVKVTGTVSEKDGRKWITASKIEKKS